MRTIIIALFISGIAFGQQGPGASIPLHGSIDAENAKLDKELARCADAEDPCGWYSNTVVVNSGSEPWRAVGDYRKTIKFWYYDDPQFAAIEDENAEESWVLRKVEIDIVSTYSEHTELYFYQGQLTELKFNGEYQSGETFDELAYFHNGVLLDGGNPGSRNDQYVKNTLETASSYIDLFLKTF